ncbi:MAG: (4Fe-4S)-binding protein [Propionibacteriaceae bacterium]|jgi:uncharacterized Fe-S cluster protein YjdI|nr:(4Fe-4S)-binding protein [Propionibacteriaceae bacterium]
MTRRSYYGPDITVTFDGARCIHAAECVRHLPAVFDTSRKPWILPSAAAADEVAATVRRCPSGALAYEAGQVQAAVAPEEAPVPVQVTAPADAPLWIHGRVTVSGPFGSEEVLRASLCRCGQTAQAPYCDASGPCNGWRG